MEGAIPIQNQFNDMPGFQCFACGAHHPNGLRLKFFKRGDEVLTTFNARDEFKGFANILHGGIQSTLLDEVMWWAAFEAKQLLCLTQRMTVEFRNATHVGLDLLVSARVVDDSGNRVDTVGEIRSAGRLVASAKGRYFYPSVRLLARSLGVDAGDLHPKLLAFVNRQA